MEKMETERLCCPLQPFNPAGESVEVCSVRIRPAPGNAGLQDLRRVPLLSGATGSARECAALVHARILTLRQGLSPARL